MTADPLKDLEGRMDALERQQRKAIRINGGDQGLVLARLDERVGQLYKWSSKVDGRDHESAKLTREIDRALAVFGQAQAGCVQMQDDRWEAHQREHTTLNQRKNIADVVAGGLGAFGIWLASKGLGT